MPVSRSLVRVIGVATAAFIFTSMQPGPSAALAFRFCVFGGLSRFRGLLQDFFEFGKKFGLHPCARIMNGGSRRRMCSCVQLMSRPFAQRLAPRSALRQRQINAENQAFAAHFADEIETRREFFKPRAQFGAAVANIGKQVWLLRRPFRNSSATAQISGPPPKVVPCIPGTNAEANCSLAMMAPSGRPPASGFATVTISGRESNF